MTNHWIDLQNCKTILMEGSNVAENHPMAFKWIRKAQENGAKIIHVDPRYTRTSAARRHLRAHPARHRRGAPEHDDQPHHRQQAVRRGLRRHPHERALPRRRGLRLQGRASSAGTTRSTTSTTRKTWGYQLDAKGKPRIAKSLDDPHCVFTRLKTHVSRYTLEMGEQITGIPAAQIQQIAETMAKNRPGAILYALGMTQHTTGVQGIRSFTILQLLLGNIGKPGGGVNALRGEPNVQGACDMAVLYNYLPGYLNSPTNAEPTICHYVRKNGIADSRYLVNMLKAFFGEAATKENDFGYAWLPKRDAVKDYGTMPMFEDALAGKLKMLWIVGQNPAVTVPNLTLTFEAMAKLETLVVQEIWETETATFWKRPGVDPKTIQTEVILLPAAFFMEKNGTITNSGGMVQWRHAAVKPPGAGQTGRRDRGRRVPPRSRAGPRLEGAEGRDHQQGLLDLHHGRGRPARDQRLRAARQPGNGPQEGRPRAQGRRSEVRRLDVVRLLDLRGRLRQRREPLQAPRLEDRPGRAGPLPGLRLDLAQQHAHPLQPRLVRPERQALSGLEADRLVGRAGEALDGIRRAGRSRRDRRTGHAQRASARSTWARRASGASSRPSTRTPTRGSPTTGATWRTCRRTARCRRCTSPSRARSRTCCTRRCKSNPMLKYPRVASHQPIGTDDKFPYVLMTSTVAEHWCAGSTTRNIPWLNELVPEPVLEMPIALGRKLGVKSGDWVKVSSARGELTVKALVTPRMKALQIDGPGGHDRLDALQLGLPGPVDRPERQPPHDRRRRIPGAGTQETKACLVNVVKASRAGARRTGRRT